ncbi:MAG: hypothetical protein FWC91_09085 [Defluviitaleaceae bacterium]|nr:hypothetical protein [Defluviitaleaceae bacterium]
MKKKVDFALLLYDEFNGKPIAGAGSIFKIGEKYISPIIKKDGFYVFCELDMDEIVLEINRPHYRPQHEHIVLNQLDPAHPVARSRLLRKNSGIYPDCKWFYGEAEPESKVLIFAETENIKATVSEAKESDTIEKNVSRLTILGCPAAELVGKRFSFDTDSGDTFLITRSLWPGTYLSNCELPHGNSKSVYAAYYSKAFVDGTICIPCDCPESIMKMLYCKKGRGSDKWVSVSVTGRN